MFTNRRFMLLLWLAGLATFTILTVLTGYQAVMIRSGSGQIMILGKTKAMESFPNTDQWTAHARLVSHKARQVAMMESGAREALALYLRKVHSEANGGEDLGSYCKLGNFSAGFVAAANQRYSEISMLGGGKERYYIAVNLYNNQAVLPNMATQLLAFADLVGHSRVFISVYENGSDKESDKTKEILAAFNTTLNLLNIPHSIMCDENGRPESYHRIEYMAQVRNRAMEPLYAGLQESEVGTFDKVIFLNDVFFCMTDLLELIHQSRFHKAHLTCAEDFEFKYGLLSFYDKWVSRDMYGQAFKGMHINIADDPDALIGQLTNQPFQVQCCWNGIAVIDAKVFGRSDEQDGIRFRRSKENECSASECSLLCNDMWGRGFGKAIVVPRVKVSYDVATRDQLRNARDNNIPAHDRPFFDESDDQIEFSQAPKTVYCHPLNGNDQNSPDGEPLFEPLFAVPAFSD